MKTILLAFALLVSAGAAFGQGKISMLNDAARSVNWGGTTQLKAAEIGLAGTAVQNTGTGATLLIDLYGGADAGSMTLQTTTTISAAAGLFGPFNFISPNLAGGQTYTMQIKVRESAYATAELAWANSGYAGFSPLFTFRPSSTIAYNSIINAGGTALSTWAQQPITVTLPLPEPSSLTLAGLGAASLLFFRRRRNPIIRNLRSRRDWRRSF